MACCSSDCILTFLYAGDNIRCQSDQFASCTHLQRPNDASHRVTCFMQWRSTAGVKDNTGHQIQTLVRWNSYVSGTIQNRTYALIHFFCLERPTPWPPRELTFPPRTPCIWNLVRIFFLGKLGKVFESSSTSGTIRNRTYSLIHFLAYNDRYYDLPEYWHFLLEHPVYEV